MAVFRLSALPIFKRRLQPVKTELPSQPHIPQIAPSTGNLNNRHNRQSRALTIGKVRKSRTIASRLQSMSVKTLRLATCRRPFTFANLQ